MFAYLVAGAIVGALAWLVRHGPGYPRLLTLLVFGLIGATIGGLGWNVAHDDGIDEISRGGFTLSALAALVLLVGVHVRVRREEDV